MDNPRSRSILIIERFLSGIITRRSQLYPPFRAIGINIIQFHDVLIDGLNIECSDLYTLQRRPGFAPWNNASLNSGEIINQFYSFRNLNGVVFPLFDSNQRLALIGTSSNATIYTKSTTAQGFVSPVGNMLYYADGTDAIKYDTVNNLASGWGIAPPTVTPTVQGFANFWQPGQFFYINTCIQDPNGNVQLVTSAGYSGTNEPVWSVTIGTATVDGNALTWQNLGSILQWYPSFPYSQPAVVVDTNGNLQWLSAVSGAPSEWDSGAAYDLGDIVSWGGQFYIAQASTTGNAPSDTVSTYWNLALSPTSTGLTAPAWSTLINGTTSDGSYTWTNVGSGTLMATAGYTWRYGYRTIYGHLSTTSPATLSTGPIMGPPSTAILGWRISSDTLYLYSLNESLPQHNPVVTMSGFTTGSFLNGQVIISSQQAPAILVSDISYTIVRSNVLTVACSSSIALSPTTIVTFENIGTATFLTGKLLSVTSGTSVSLSVASCNDEVGSNTVYNGTFSSGGSNAYAGQIFTVSGFVTNPGNNGTFYCNASTTTTITLENIAGISESASATATSNSIVANLTHSLYALTADTGNAILPAYISNGAFTHADVGLTQDGGTVALAFSGLSGQGTANTLCNATVAVTHVNVTADILTVTAANNLAPPCSMTFSGLTNAAFLNNQQVQIIFSTPTYFQAVFVHANYDGSESTGFSGSPPVLETPIATFNAVEIYRTADGGGIWYFDGAVTNPEGGNPPGTTWTFYDFTPDYGTATVAGLNNLLPAPINHQNDPPPGQPGSLIPTPLSLLVWHQGRHWGASGSQVFFDGGPDVLNGVPEESWPPANVFDMPGAVTGFWSTNEGLLVQTSDKWHVIVGGPQTLSYWPEKVMDNFGISTPNCIHQDGNDAVVLSTQGQFFLMSPQSKEEIGQKVGDMIVNDFQPTSSYATVHRNGLDSGIYLSNGSNKILRFGLNTGNWSPLYAPVMGVGALNSIETSPGIYSLMLSEAGAEEGSPPIPNQIYYRNINAFADDGQPYDAFATIGSVTLSGPGQPLVPLCQVLGYFVNVGNPAPLMSVLFNEIAAVNGAEFVNLPEYVNEPPIGCDPSLSLLQLRWLVRMNTSGTSLMVHHVQLRVDFGNTSTARDELLAIALKSDEDN